jgi:hypothetical protein
MVRRLLVATVVAFWVTLTAVAAELDSVAVIVP